MNLKHKKYEETVPRYIIIKLLKTSDKEKKKLKTLTENKQWVQWGKHGNSKFLFGNREVTSLLSTKISGSLKFHT